MTLIKKCNAFRYIFWGILDLNHKLNVSSYALKLLKGYFFYGLEDMEKYIQEIEFIKRIKHKHIIEYIDHFYDKSGCPCILTKYYQVYILFSKQYWCN